MTISQSFAEHLIKPLSGTEYQFQLMRREERAQPRYEHLWNGWGWRLRHILEFDTWDALLRPTIASYVDVPRGPVRTAVGRMRDGALGFGEIDFGEQPDPGVYPRVVMSDMNGVMLAEIAISHTLFVRAGDFVTLTSIKIGFT